MRMLVVALLALASMSGVARAQEDLAPDTNRALGRDRDGRPSPEMVRERLRTLMGEARAEELAGDTLEHARNALARADALHEAGLLPAAERARQIAWAALTLASRQIARAREREALARARRRLAAAQARAARSREALEHAMRQRARAVAAEREPVEGTPVGETTDEEEDDSE